MKKIGLNSLKRYMILSLLILTMMAMSVAGTGPNPDPVTNLHNVSYALDYINWAWTDPARAEGNLVSIEVYIDGVYKQDVNRGVQYYNAMNLIPDTEYEISTRTVDKQSDISSEWNNKTARTASVTPLDNTYPTTTITRIGDYKGNDWFASPVDITLLATDDMSGVQRTEYRFTTGGSWTTYTGSFIINTEGDTLIQYRSIDNADNTELINSSLIRIDTIYPIITVTGVTNGETYNTALTPIITPIITVTDTNLIYRSSTLNGNTYYSGTGISQNGNYWLNTTASDVVGHVTNSNISFTIYSGPIIHRGNQTKPIGIVIKYLIS